MPLYLIVIHVTVSLLLIFIVLVQGGKGAELGAAFGGGSSQTLFGGRGAATFLGKMTTVIAVVFMLTSLLLAISSVRSKSIIPESIPAANQSQQAPIPGTAPLTAPVQGSLPQGQSIPQGVQPPAVPAESAK